MFSYTALTLAILGILILSSAIKVLREYERAVIFRLGRSIGMKGPGLILLIPIIDKMVRISLRTVAMDVPPQDVITRDNVTVKVNAVIYFRVIDPRLAVIEVIELSVRHIATGADHAAFCAGRSGPGWVVGAAREAQRKAAIDSRPAHFDMGSEGNDGGGQAGGSVGADDPRARAAGGKRNASGAPRSSTRKARTRRPRSWRWRRK
jgi:Membrane protease subunits, stomatin/prohibitin homologs